MSTRELIGKLKRERLARDGFVPRDPSLEELEHAAKEEERVETYIAGLREERRRVEAELVRLRQQRPDRRAWQAWERRDDKEPPTTAERVIAAERRLASIDAELARVSR